MNKTTTSNYGRSNSAPFSDVCEFVTIITAEDADGYETPTETTTEVFCSVCGVVRSEFYEAMKAGIQMSLSLEVWEDDYNDAELLDFGKKRYKIERTFPTGHGTLQLYCSEVKR